MRMRSTVKMADEDVPVEMEVEDKAAADKTDQKPLEKDKDTLTCEGRENSVDYRLVHKTA